MFSISHWNIPWCRRHSKWQLSMYTISLLLLPEPSWFQTAWAPTSALRLLFPWLILVSPHPSWPDFLSIWQCPPLSCQNPSLGAVLCSWLIACLSILWCMLRDNVALIGSQSVLHCCRYPKKQAEQWFMISTKGEMADKQVIVKTLYTQKVSQHLFVYLRIPLIGCYQNPPVSLHHLACSARVLPWHHKKENASQNNTSFNLGSYCTRTLNRREQQLWKARSSTNDALSTWWKGSNCRQLGKELTVVSQ